MTDPEVIHNHLDHLERQVRLLESLRDRSFEEFSNDELAVAAAQHCVQIAAQNVLDIGAHILADVGENGWNEYREIPAALVRHNVISEDLSHNIRKLAGMRNIIVHLYDEVDLHQVYDVIRIHLDTFRKFAASLKRYLESTSE